jgi:hypothetical protein
MRPVYAVLTLSLLVITVTIPLLSEVVSSGVEVDDNSEVIRIVAQTDAVAERRRAVVDDLLAGRRTLHEAAAQFRVLAADAPYDVRDWMRRQFSSVASEEARFHEHVLVCSTVRARERGLDSARTEALRRELDALHQAGAFADRL